MSQGYKNNSYRKNLQETDYPFEKEQMNRRKKTAPPPQKPHREKVPATVEEQIEKLKERGCIVEDEEQARETLTDINYFRLAHYFSLFLEENGKYREGTKFGQVIRVYDFDRRLRHLLMEVLEEIEITLRAHCSNYHAIRYGATGYLNADTFSHVHKHQSFLSKIQKLIETNRESEMVQHYIKKHNGEFPLWVIMELFSFGGVNLFYSDLKPQDKMTVSKQYYGLSSGTLEMKLRMLSDLRNHCAHYHRLYDWEIGDIHSAEGTVFEYILIMKEIYRRPRKWRDGFLKQFRRLYYDYTDIVDLAMLGFPENWLDLLSEDEGGVARE
ncbi:MAG: Abi family protein [Bacteroides sp.]|nr:Abi family protein [Bacteroides sp.]